jgi:hypothetical protein
MAELKQLKQEIEHVQHLIDRAKVQQARDFDLYMQSRQGKRMGKNEKEIF